MNVNRVAIVAHARKPDAKEVADSLSEWLGSRSIEVTEADPDLVVSLGGDGTMLRAAKLAHSAEAPLLGVNLGRVGYLTEIEMSNEQSALEAVFAGDFSIEERMMLSCRVLVGGETHEYVGLNEVLLERATRHRLVHVQVTVGDEQLGSFGADGVIVATPTGSTAYALSAGGPIVSPRAECLVLVPVSAHMILARPFIFAADETVTLTVAEGDQTASLVIDGTWGQDIPPGVPVDVSRHQRPLRLVKLTGPDFIARLRMKLGLPG
ncbi:MAG TPA: NAD(+)/NADH kinase [Actinomycetota bacterium]|nr:NAD(+)/NADH kinase [Actinomycetota bacterium]